MVKRLLYIWLLVLCCGCDVIRENDRFLPIDTPADERAHVLLDFTGFLCVNCPTAAERAHDLQQLYPGRLYVVSLHPASNPFTQGLYDYTCPAADSIYRRMGGTASTPFPAGNVDMTPYEGEWFADQSEWPTMVYRAMQDTAAVPPVDRLRTTYWLIEDSVLGAQRMPDGSVNTSYYHRHLLRGAWDSTDDIVVPDGCNADRLYLLTLYLDPKNNKILHAYETTFRSLSHP